MTRTIHVCPHCQRTFTADSAADRVVCPICKTWVDTESGKERRRIRGGSQ